MFQAAFLVLLLVVGDLDACASVLDERSLKCNRVMRFQYQLMSIWETADPPRKKSDYKPKYWMYLSNLQ